MATRYPTSERIPTAPTSAARGKLNGVDVGQLQETMALLDDDPTLAHCRFRATNRWINGAHSRCDVEGFFAAGDERMHDNDFTFELDEPELMLGGDYGASPVECVLAALSACLTTTLVYHATARGIELEQIESDYEGELDLRGLLGIEPNVRKGFQVVRVNFRIIAEASQDQLDELLDVARRHSSVLDMLTQPVEVHLGVEKVDTTMLH